MEMEPSNFRGRELYDHLLFMITCNCDTIFNTAFPSKHPHCVILTWFVISDIESRIWEKTFGLRNNFVKTFLEGVVL